MKVIFFILVFITSYFVKGQNLTFTNQNLKNHLINDNCVDLDENEWGDFHIDLNNDNEIQITEANNIENLVIATNLTISNLNDLQQFTNLKRLVIHGDCGLTEISNLNLDSLQHIRISDHNSITDIDLSDLPNLNSIIIEGLNGLNHLNLQNGSLATEAFSLFYTYFNSACVDSIAEEYNFVVNNIINGGVPTVNCVLNTNEVEEYLPLFYPTPSKEKLTITIPFTKASIYNIYGQMVYESYNLDKEINIKEFQSGIYLLDIETNNGTNIQQKILIK